MPDPSPVTAPVLVARPSALWIVIGTALVALAGWLFGIVVDADFVPFLLCLVGGWMCGYFVAGLLLGDGGWRRICGLAAVAAALTFAAWALIGPLADHVGMLPLLARSAVLAVQFASLTGVGWLWLVTISALTQRTKRSPATLKFAEWEHDDHRSWLTFPAIPMSLRTIAWSIVVIVLAGGLAVAGILIATGDRLLFAGPRFMIVLLGALFGFPAYLLLVFVLRRRQVTAIVDFREASLIVTTDHARTVLPLGDVTLLRWGGNGEYSRLLLRTVHGVRISLVAGMAKVPFAHTSTLPPLPRPVVRRLELAGLVEKAAPKKANVSRIFERPV